MPRLTPCSVGDLRQMSASQMIYDGRWKLCKYSTGEHLFFDLEEDPTEQNNLLKKGEYREVYDRLDAALVSQIMRSVTASHHDKTIYGADLSGDLEFGGPGWRRAYPDPL